MNDDMDTPNALNVIKNLAEKILKEKDKIIFSSLQISLKTALDVLGFN